MSLLRAIDEAIEVRNLIHKLGDQLEGLDIAEDTKTELLETYYPIWDLINRVVADSEGALVPAGLKVAVSFMPDLSEERVVGEEELGYRIPRRGGDPRGTLLLPSDPPE